MADACWRAEPQARFFADGGFFTNDRKARFVAPEVPALRTETTAGAAVAAQHRPHPRSVAHHDPHRHRARGWASICRSRSSRFIPTMPIRYGVADGDFARVTTDYGQCMLKVVVSERQQRGMLFAPIHWSEANASAARVGALVAPFTDPFSGQPENKATPASIAPYEYVFRGFALSRKPLELPGACLVDARGGQRRLWLSASPTMPTSRDGNPGCGRSPATISPNTGILAAAFIARPRLPADRIETCLFVGPARDAGDWNVVKSLFAADALSDDQRRMLLSGKSADGLASAGPIVCACFGVGRNTICDAIAAGATLGRRDRRAS